MPPPDDVSRTLGKLESSVDACKAGLAEFKVDVGTRLDAIHAILDNGFGKRLRDTSDQVASLETRVSVLDTSFETYISNLDSAKLAVKQTVDVVNQLKSDVAIMQQARAVASKWLIVLASGVGSTVTVVLGGVILLVIKKWM
jgi:hypothetical protein